MFVIIEAPTVGSLGCVMPPCGWWSEVLQGFLRTGLAASEDVAVEEPAMPNGWTRLLTQKPAG